MERNILFSYVLLVCFDKVNKADKANFLHPTSLKRGAPQFLFYLILYLFFFIIIIIIIIIICEQNSFFICCKAETPKTSATVKK